MKYLETLYIFTEEIESMNKNDENDIVIDRLVLTYNTIASSNGWDSQMTTMSWEGEK